MQRTIFRIVRDLTKTGRREVRRFFASPYLALMHVAFRWKLITRDWQGLHRMLRPLGDAALQSRDYRLLSELGYAALRLDEPQLGAQLLFSGRQAAGKVAANAWRGEDISDATLIIQIAETRNQGVAVGLEYIGYIAAAVARAANTIVVVEARMAPLFARTLADVTVVPYGTDLSAYSKERLVTATTNDLAVGLGYCADTIAKFFHPVVPDAAKTQLLRQRYLGGRSGPLIGLSWTSSHFGKDLPSAHFWTQLINDLPSAQLISLQYGDVVSDLKQFNSGDPSRVISDPEIDQMRDMDSFAAQIAALDLVITISNSGAHLAGALGQQMILIRDDLFRRNWPYLSRQVPWYPRTRVIGKDGRSWTETFAEIATVARTMVDRNIADVADSGSQVESPTKP